ncbi:MAG: hypothetical protein LBT10_02535 [Methanobrevibacter sp.]|nr:hypothetical protein [Methanobrevibacter sp.]
MQFETWVCNRKKLDHIHLIKLLSSIFNFSIMKIHVNFTLSFFTASKIIACNKGSVKLGWTFTIGKLKSYDKSLSDKIRRFPS